MRHFAIALAVMVPSFAFAVGSDDDTPPTPTQTTTTCEAGQVFDTKSQSCVDKSSTLIDDDTRYQAVRELAYAGAFHRAAGVLDAMDQDDSRVLTYRGFLARKTGNLLAANAYYRAALDVNPDNLLARSYMGQGLAIAGDIKAARTQLTEIRIRGGRNSWAEAALKHAIERGTAASY